jgi:hypothetical protein
MNYTLPHACPASKCPPKTCKKGWVKEAQVWGREFFLDGPNATICRRRSHCGRCVPLASCSDVKPVCKPVVCGNGTESYNSSSVIRRDRNTHKACLVIGCPACRKCLNNSTCRISPCPALVVPKCTSDEILITAHSANGCPGVQKCKSKHCPQRKCRKLPRKCSSGRELVHPPARNVTRSGGTYSCLWTPCPKCRKIKCPNYRCVYRACRSTERRWTPRDSHGCAMCPSCKPAHVSVEQFDAVESEKDDI